MTQIGQYGGEAKEVEVVIAAKKDLRTLVLESSRDMIGGIVSVGLLFAVWLGRGLQLYWDVAVDIWDQSKSVIRTHT
jgi:hypothetical protein